MFSVSHPLTGGMDPFPGIDGGQLADDGEEIPSSFGFDPEDSESGLFVEERHAFNETCQLFGCWAVLRHGALVGVVDYPSIQASTRGDEALDRFESSI